MNKAYAAALRMDKHALSDDRVSPAEGGQYASVLERARASAEDYLVHFPPERRGAILLGALASVYGKEDGGADTAVWLAERKGGAGQSQSGMAQSSIAHETIEALREIGLLDEIIATKEGLVVYLSEMDAAG